VIFFKQQLFSIFLNAWISLGYYNLTKSRIKCLMKNLYNYFSCFVIFSDDTFAHIICALVLIIGCLSIIIGYKYPSIDRSLPSCMIGGILGYTIALSTGDYSTASNHAYINFYRNILRKSIYGEFFLRVFSWKYYSRGTALYFEEF